MRIDRDIIQGGMMNMMYGHLEIDIMRCLKLPTQVTINGRCTFETEGTMALLANLF